MNKIIRFSQITLFVFLCGLFTFVLSGCAQVECDDSIHRDGQTVAVPIQINGLYTEGTKSIETDPYTVDRILILPLKKINESIVANTGDNFEPDYTAAKQVDISSLVTYVTMLDFTAGSTYAVIVIGYNQADYDFNSQGSPGERFSIGSTTMPALFENLHLLLADAADVPEFFVGTCTSYNGSVPVGAYFKPDQINLLETTITRISSGLNLEIANVPDSVTSITLIAETLVKGIHPVTFEATVVEDPEDPDNLKTFSSQAPVSGDVSFNHFILPTSDAHKTKFYLDVQSGANTKRFPVIVNDLAGVSSGNSITFTPNDAVKISGDYSKVDFGFIIGTNPINLEDDAWDGLE